MFHLVDKPIGVSSFSAAARTRRALKAWKAGHTGTLDPLASGLLIIATNGSTKLIPYFDADRKTYRFTVDFSKTSESLDLWTDVVEIDAAEIDAARRAMEGCGLLESLDKFRGKIRQVPPKYSAIRIDGKRAYRLARWGKDFEIPERDAEIFSLELISFEFPFATFTAEVSAGTYVRSLARDLWAEFCVGAVVTELRRTAIGNLSVDRAVAPPDATVENSVNPAELLPDLAVVLLWDDVVAMLCAGISQPCPSSVEEGRHALVKNSEDYVSLCVSQNGYLTPLRNAIGW